MPIINITNDTPIKYENQYIIIKCSFYNLLFLYKSKKLPKQRHFVKKISLNSAKNQTPLGDTRGVSILDIIS